MGATLELGGVTLAVLKKDIKNVHLSVYPPAGRVSVSAPRRMSLDTIRLFAIAKLGWIGGSSASCGSRSGKPSAIT